jgi:hypothetical protein
MSARRVYVDIAISKPSIGFGVVRVRCISCGARRSPRGSGMRPGTFPTLVEVNASPELLVLGAQLERVLQERYIPVARDNSRQLREIRAAETARSQS